MRRAAADGADAASRAAIVGGATSTSNSAVAYELGLTPAGTHAHSMVQLFLALGEGEDAAFDAYADVYPDDTLLLVDTVDTLGSGIPNAIATFERLRRAGHEPVGDPPRLRRPRLPRRAGGARARPGRVPGHRHRAVQPARRADDLADHGADRRRGPPPRRRSRRRHRAARVRRRLAAGDERRRPEPRRRVQAGRRRRRRRRVAAGDEALGLAGQGAQPRRQAAVAGVRRRAAGRVADVLSTAGETLRAGERLHLHHHARPDVSRTADGGRRRRAAVDRWSTAAGSSPRRRGDLAGRGRSPPVATSTPLDPGVRRLVNPHTYHVSITDDLFALKQALLAGLDEFWS